MKLSFSLPSKSSSSSNPNLARPSKEFADKTLDHDRLRDSKEYVNEFDASKPLSETGGKSRNFVMPPLENEWRPLKKMKNLEVPLDQSMESDLKFESASGSDPPDDSNISFGLNVRQSVGGAKSADEPELLPRPVPLEVIMLDKFKADLKRLPEDRGFEDYEDLPVESFAAALMEGYGWREGRGVGRNAKEDVKVKEYNRRTDKQGLGFVGDAPVGISKEEEKDRGRERKRDEGRELERKRDEGRERQINRDESRDRERNGDESRDCQRNGDESRDRQRNVDESRDRQRNGDESRDRQRNVDESRDRQRNGDESRDRQRNRDESRDRQRNGDESRDRQRNRDESRVKEDRNGGRVKENKDRESDGLAIGKNVRIVGGRDAGWKGRIVEKLDPNWLVLKLSKREEQVNVKVRVTDVAELGSKEEERFFKKLEKLKVQDETEGQKRRREVERVVEKRESGTRDEEKKRNSRLSWLTSHIRVRIISKDLKGGKFYLKKGEIVDVVGPNICDVSIDGSRELVQGVSQELLETALPRRGGPVLVLYGKHKGVYGSLVERDLDKEIGVVRDADNHELLNVRLEQIAEYIGDPSYLGY